MSRPSWDTQGLSWRVLAIVVALAVAATIFAPGGWQSSRPGAGSAQAQISDNPPPEEPKEGGVSEFLEAAKLGALASGNVIAGPGQVVIPAGQEETGRLWSDTLLGGRQASKELTLTVQGVGGCVINFLMHFPNGSHGSLQVGHNHESTSRTAAGIDFVSYIPQTPPSSDCLFLWVLRETGVSVRSPR
ncbi:MAG: hypothetical protein WD646_05420 [Actinomycetota bacterium]